jgi:hypothetical protein
MMKMRE